MAVRSTRFFGPTAFVAGGTTVFTCPAGRTAVFHGLFVQSTGATPQHVRIYVNGTLALQQGTQDQGGATFSGVGGPQIILNPGDTLGIGSDNVGGVATGFGSLLLGAPT